MNRFFSENKNIHITAPSSHYLLVTMYKKLAPKVCESPTYVRYGESMDLNVHPKSFKLASNYPIRADPLFDSAEGPEKRS